MISEIRGIEVPIPVQCQPLRFRDGGDDGRDFGTGQEIRLRPGARAIKICSCQNVPGFILEQNRAVPRSRIPRGKDHVHRAGGAGAVNEAGPVGVASSAWWHRQSPAQLLPAVTTTADPTTPGVRKVKATLWLPLADAMGREPKLVAAGALAVAATAEFTTKVTAIVAVPGKVT